MVLCKLNMHERDIDARMQQVIRRERLNYFASLIFIFFATILVNRSQRQATEHSSLSSNVELEHESTEIHSRGRSLLGVASQTSNQISRKSYGNITSIFACDCPPGIPGPPGPPGPPVSFYIHVYGPTYQCTTRSKQSTQMSYPPLFNYQHRALLHLHSSPTSSPGTQSCVHLPSMQPPWSSKAVS